MAEFGGFGGFGGDTGGFDWMQFLSPDFAQKAAMVMDPNATVPMLTQMGGQGLMPPTGASSSMGAGGMVGPGTTTMDYAQIMSPQGGQGLRPPTPTDMPGGMGLAPPPATAGGLAGFTPQPQTQPLAMTPEQLRLLAASRPQPQQPHFAAGVAPPIGRFTPMTQAPFGMPQSRAPLNLAQLLYGR